MQVFNNTAGGSFKQINISPDSVNSVLLDSNPQDSYERLIVSGRVTQNDSGTTYNLQNTTVMPNIRGLSSLIPFVFSPTIELR